ncbi:hypothetical protein [Leptospira idonii]|uniref:hypothetical protein n=1 Tax=Leptospira idonii TaxID=1193500 RepID=UPI001AEF48E4|nr:hypothetical protein [Leptospira idonii]
MFRNIFLFTFLFFFAVGTISADEPNTNTSSVFAHPLQVEPVAVYTKVRGNISYWDKRQNGVYEENKNINIEGEFRFWQNFSVISSIGKNRYSYTNSEPENTWDRWNVGLKYGKIWDTGTSQFLFGAGLRLYDKKRGGDLKERENPEYYLVRPNVGFGFKRGPFEIMSELRFQTETNSKGRESNLEEFRRYYQVGIAPSYGVSPSVRIFAELEYREPFDKTVDTRTRYFNFYPGFSYKTESLGTFSLSAQFAGLAKNENAMDHGVRFSYFYFFDTESAPSNPTAAPAKDKTTETN